MVDFSNVAKYFDLAVPKVKNINIMFNELKYKYYVIGVVDWSIVDSIDYRDYFFERYLNPKICFAVPYADPIILELAQKYWCFIVSNDTFRNLSEELCDKNWLNTHRISFKIENGRFTY